MIIDHTQARITDAGVDADRKIQTPKSRYITSHSDLPDLLSALQEQTELTRTTLLDIIKRRGRLSEFKGNPQAFITEAGKQIRKALDELLVDGIRYEKLNSNHAGGMPSADIHIH